MYTYYILIQSVFCSIKYTDLYLSRTDIKSTFKWSLSNLLFLLSGFDLLTQFFFKKHTDAAEFLNLRSVRFSTSTWMSLMFTTWLKHIRVEIFLYWQLSEPMLVQFWKHSQTSLWLWNCGFGNNTVMRLWDYGLL